ncbi:MAG: FAD/NAD(P)-binding protein [Mycobacteriales bacterium]
MTTVAIVGLGSRGLGVLERVVTLAKRRGPAAGPVRVDVVDPTCDGAGVHDRTQPDYLLLNTTCSQVSMFPDAATVGDEVDAPGPSLHEWVTERGLRLAADGFTVVPEGCEGRPVHPTDFLPRRVLGDYLAWVLGEVQRRAPSHVDIRLHRAEVVDLDPDRLEVALSTGGRLRADHTVLTTGYTPNAVDLTPDGARTTGPYPLPERVAGIEPGQVAAVAGFGLSAMDVMSCLTVGRGGRFVADAGADSAHGGLRYLPSGREPALLFLSRTGLPCRARPRTVEFGETYRPLVFSTATIDAVRRARGGPLDFDADVLPLVLTEIRVAYRRCQARLDGTTEALEADLAADVAATLDRLDAERDRFDAAEAFDGTGGMPLDGPEAYQKWLAEVLRADLAEGLLGFAGSPLKAGLDVLRALRDTFRYAVDFGGLTAASLDAFHRRTVPALNRAVVGPQWERHAELLALLDAGLARAPFGPDPAVSWGGRMWTMSSTRLAEPYATDVDWVIAAYVDLPTVDTSASPLLAALHRRGAIRPHRADSRWVRGIDVDRDQHPIDTAGRAHPHLWVLGPLCEGATFYNNLVPSPNVHSRPVHDAHRTAAAILTP